MKSRDARPSFGDNAAERFCNSWDKIISLVRILPAISVPFAARHSRAVDCPTTSADTSSLPNDQSGRLLNEDRPPGGMAGKRDTKLESVTWLTARTGKRKRRSPPDRSMYPNNDSHLRIRSRNFSSLRDLTPVPATPGPNYRRWRRYLVNPFLRRWSADTRPIGRLSSRLQHNRLRWLVQGWWNQPGIAFAGRHYECCRSFRQSHHQRTAENVRLLSHHAVPSVLLRRDVWQQRRAGRAWLGPVHGIGQSARTKRILTWSRS